MDKDLNQNEQLGRFEYLGLRNFSKSSGSGRHFDQQGTRVSLLMAYNIIILSIATVTVYIYAAFISKLLPDSGVWILDMLKKDSYFCYLIPLLVLPTYIVVYLNWLCMQIFQHN